MTPERTISDFAALAEHLRGQHRRRKVAIVCPNDPHSQYVMERARDEGVAEFLVFNSSVPGEAAREAVEAVRQGMADVLMKGKINTDDLLRAVLDKQHGLLSANSVLSHVTVAHIPACDKLLAFADAAVIPRPDLEQFDAITKYLVDVTRRIGTSAPKVALIHCTEKTNEKFPHTLYYNTLKERARQGRYGNAIVDGPMDVKTALDRESGAIKGINSPVAGKADALVFPNIEAGNTFYKTITLLANATPAGMLCGTTAPVVVTSRADSGVSKYYSLALACLNA